MEEMDLRELVGIPNKHRKIIVGIIIASLLLSIIYVSFIAVPVYQTDVEIGIIEINTGLAKFDETNNTKVMADILLSESASGEFFSQIGKELKSNNIAISADELKSAISARKSKDGKKIIISARYKEKNELVPIVDTAVKVLDNRATEYITGEIRQQMAIMEKQLEFGKAKSAEVMSKYDVYTTNENNPSNLQSDVDMANDVLGQLKADLISNNIGPGKSKAQLEQEIAKLEEEVQSLSEKLTDASMDDILHKEELSSSLEAYKSLNEEYSRLKFSEAYYKENANIEVLSNAEDHIRVSSPDKKDIVLISVFVGLCIGVLAALLIEYFESRK